LEIWVYTPYWRYILKERKSRRCEDAERPLCYITAMKQSNNTSDSGIPSLSGCIVTTLKAAKLIGSTLETALPLIKQAGKDMYGENRRAEDIVRGLLHSCEEMGEELEERVRHLVDVAGLPTEATDADAGVELHRATSVSPKSKVRRQTKNTRRRKGKEVLFTRFDGQLGVSVTPRSGKTYEHWAGRQAVSQVPLAVSELSKKGDSFSFLELDEYFQRLDSKSPKPYELRLVVRFMREKDLLERHSRGRYMIPKSIQKEYRAKVEEVFSQLPLWMKGASYGG
jgi:hypothetical protein